MAQENDLGLAPLALLGADDEVVFRQTLQHLFNIARVFM
jgi:hypothetical protein